MPNVPSPAAHQRSAVRTRWRRRYQSGRIPLKSARREAPRRQARRRDRDGGGEVARRHRSGGHATRRGQHRLPRDRSSCRRRSSPPESDNKLSNAGTASLPVPSSSAPRTTPARSSSLPSPSCCPCTGSSWAPAIEALFVTRPAAIPLAVMVMVADPRPAGCRPDRSRSGPRSCSCRASKPRPRRSRQPAACR